MADVLTTGVGQSDLARLAQAAAGGDGAAFRAWVEATTPVLYRLALRLSGSTAEAEDVVQESHIRAWRGLAELRDPQASLAWVCRIARSVASDRRRQAARRPQEPFDDTNPEQLRQLAGALAPTAAGADEQLVQAEQRQAVRRALDGLPDKHRVILLLRAADELTAPEIAAALGIPVGTVESRLHRAREALRRKLLAAERRHPWLPW